MLGKTEGAIKNGQSRETGSIVHTSRRKTKQKQSTICVGHHYTQTNTNNVNRICTPANNWRYRRTEHRFYVEIVSDIAILEL